MATIETVGRASWAMSAAAAVMVLAGCEGGEESPAALPATNPPAATASSAQTCPAAEVAGQIDPGSVLVPGPDNGLSKSTAPGEPLVVAGAVLDPGCQAAAGASVRVWHTDASGAYGPTAGQCCYYQGTVRTDQQGRFRLDTIRPGQYAQSNAPPAHIHLEVRHASGQLETEIVFTGDPDVPSTGGRGMLPVTLTETGAADRSWYGEATLVLQP